MIKVSQQTIDEFSGVFLNKNNTLAHEIISGSGNVIITAPHSVEQTREGKIKYGEYQTGVLSKLIHEYTKCPIAYKLRNNNDDANFDKVCEFKNSVIEYITVNKIMFLLDLHQMAPFRNEMIDIGTGKGNNIFSRNDIVSKIFDSFTIRNIKNVKIDYHFNASYENTVSATISRICKIPAFQIEINSRLLCAKYSDYNFDSVLEALIDIINFLELFRGKS